MHITSTIQFFASASLVFAAPAPLNVGTDDVILYGNGRHSLMKRADFAELEAARSAAIAPPKPGYLNDALTTYTGNETSNTLQRLSKRDATLILPNPKSRFLGWDIQMSQVVKGAPTSISVSSGYSISNTISVGTSSQFTLVKDFLSVSMSVDYSQSWQAHRLRCSRSVCPRASTALLLAIRGRTARVGMFGAVPLEARVA
jgi:hypothetical protein